MQWNCSPRPQCQTFCGQMRDVYTLHPPTSTHWLGSYLLQNGFSFSSSSGAWRAFASQLASAFYEKCRQPPPSKLCAFCPAQPTFPFVFGALSLLEYNSLWEDGSISITTWQPHGYRIIIHSVLFPSVWCRVFRRVFFLVRVLSNIFMLCTIAL